MPFHAFVMPLTVLAVALPFLFAVTNPPSPNFWPLVFAWACGLCLAVCGLVTGARVQSRSQAARWWGRAARVLAWGLLLAAVVGGVVGLLQYLGEEPWGLPWIHPSSPGQAVGNLRQRNQQATLMAMGVWALLWLWVRGARAPRPWAGLGVVLGGLLSLLALASAATASRTGALQWGLIVVMPWLWRRTDFRKALAVAVLGAVVYALAAWALPQVLLHAKGLHADGLFARLGGDARQCASRQVLWSNMLHLIALKPWAGWGWGELGYAHYTTLFPGERFCMLLDNAHNLPLQLAVELGLPAALLLCGTAVACVVRARPWRETDPVRQLAWGLVGLVTVHSLLEYPLWYGPFQVATLFALVLLLCRRGRGRASVDVGEEGERMAGISTRPVPGAGKGWHQRLALAGGDGAVWWGLGGAACLAGAALLAMATYQYRTVSQLYKPVDQRPAHLRDVRAVPAPAGTLFPDQVRFAWLTTHPLTPANAVQMHAVALALLHFSPEPRVIDKLLDSAQALGLDDEVAFHRLRYRIAYPAEYARWQAARSGAAASGLQP